MKKLIWLVVSGLMVLSLMLASCAPAAVEEEEKKVALSKEVEAPKEVVVPKEVVAPKEAVVPKEGVPQYGGTLVTTIDADLAHGFDATSWMKSTASWEQRMANEQLLVADPLKGPAGTREWTGLHRVAPGPDIVAPNLAESWKIDESGGVPKLKFKIRKGVFWQDKPPMNGAELTPADVVYNYRYIYGVPGSYFVTTRPNIRDMKNPSNSIYLDPADPRTVVFEAAPDKLGPLFEAVAAYAPVYYGEAFGPIEKSVAAGGYGSWKNLVGTGSMMLTDYTVGSSLTWKRNPNYWKEDVLHPGNQLPYIDEERVLIIPDLSTRQAALRTGRVDILRELAAEDAESLMKTNPELKSVVTQGRGPVLMMRNDVGPFSDIRVRQAMMLAIDQDEMNQSLYGGKGAKIWWPSYPIAEYSNHYLSLEEYPRDVQELFEYHPDKAKSLLAEAGYPNGFKTSVHVVASSTDLVNLCEIVKYYWQKVGVDLEIVPVASGVYTSMQRKQSFPEGRANDLGAGIWRNFTFERVGSVQNTSHINDPFIEKLIVDFASLYFQPEELNRVYKEALPEVQRRAFHVFLPQPVNYTLWQPWLGGYHGEVDTFQYLVYEQNVAEYIWINQGLKEKLGR